MNHFYAAGQQRALTTLGLKTAEERVPVSHEGDADNETYQRQALTTSEMPNVGPGVSTVWDQFEDRVQNPSVTTDRPGWGA